MWLILAIVIIGAVLITYTRVERRINQRPCPECGFRVSIDGLDEDCPHCGAMIPRREES